jgi:hypothetical protein
MTDQQENTFDIKVRLTMFDYYRYYFSLFNLKLSGLIVSIFCVIIILVYSMSLISLIYIAAVTKVYDLPTIRGILLDFLIATLFATPFIRTYLIAYKDAKTHHVLDKDIYITITKDKFIVAPNGTKLEYPWKKMYKIFEFYHGFALFIDKKELAFVLPKRCFKNKQQLKALKQIVAKYKSKGGL